MAQSPGRFQTVLLIGWLALGVAGFSYARFTNIPNWAAFPAIAAFLMEYPFYLVPAFPEIRKRFSNRWLPALLVVSAVLPYLACYIPLGRFEWMGFLKLAALAAGLSVWYVILPASVLTDLAFLAVLAAALIGKYFDAIYPDPYPKLKIAYLGHIALAHITALVLLVQRHIRETGYGFIPNWREWRIGALHYLCFLPVAAAIAIPLRAVRFAGPAPVWRTVAIFLAFLWVVTLFEEFIFRGVLQQWLEEWTWSQRAALAVTSVVFGSVHLWLGKFPNWRWALIAGVLGLFCGHARNQAGSIRAGMVTHALVVATWRGFFA